MLHPLSVQLYTELWGGGGGPGGDGGGGRGGGGLGGGGLGGGGEGGLGGGDGSGGDGGEGGLGGGDGGGGDGVVAETLKTTSLPVSKTYQSPFTIARPTLVALSGVDSPSAAITVGALLAGTPVPASV